MHDFMTTKEVAAYLRIKERRVYELVRQRAIPCTRVTGKWLFPKTLIDLWLADPDRQPAPADARRTAEQLIGAEVLDDALRDLRIRKKIDRNVKAYTDHKLGRVPITLAPMTAPIIAAVFAAVGVVLTVIQAGVVGPLARRIGEANLIRLGLSINVAGFLVTSVASTWPSLALGLLGLAVGQGLTVPACRRPSPGCHRAEE